MLRTPHGGVKLSVRATRASRANVGLRGRVVALLVLSACVTPPAERRRSGLPAEPLAAAFVAIGAGDYDEADRELTEVARRHPVLEDYALYFRARVAARAGRTADALEAARALRDRHPDSIWAARSLLLTGEAMRASGDRDGARRWLAAARDALPHGDAHWARATVGLAEVEVEQSESPADWTEALALARDVRRSQPGHVAGRRARRLTERIRAASPALDPTDHVDEAEIRLREGDPRGARDEAMSALADEPSSALTARALWVRAQAEHRLGLDGADVTCLTLARELPGEPLAPRALQAAAGWRWNKDDDGAALDLFRDLARRFPTSAQAPEALYAIGRIYQEEGARARSRYADAASAYLRLADAYPESPLAAEARWRAGWVRYLAGDFAGAEAGFAQLAAQNGGTVGYAAEYWRARALDRLGNEDGAREQLEHIVGDHPASYYAGLAEERLGRPSPALELPVVVPPPPFPATLGGPHAERAVLLARLAFPRFARLELEIGRAHV